MLRTFESGQNETGNTPNQLNISVYIKVMFYMVCWDFFYFTGRVVGWVYRLVYVHEL